MFKWSYREQINLKIKRSFIDNDGKNVTKEYDYTDLEIRRDTFQNRHS